MNNIKTTLLMLALIILFVLVGNFIAGKEGMIWAFMIAVMMNGIAYWFSDKIVLMMYNAKEVKEDDLPEIYNIIKELTAVMSLPMPKVYIIETQTPNAFATGRNPQHSAVALTVGILNILDRKELRGVIAHELSHIKNRDTLICFMSATIAGAIFTLARLAQWTLLFGGGGRRDQRGSSNMLSAIGLLLTIIIAPLAAMIIQFAISRSREYEADRTAAVSTKDPISLANALRKIHYAVQHRPLNAHPTTAHMFIVNPLKGESLLNLFSTHPSVDERIKRLEDLHYSLQQYNIPTIVR